MSDRAKDIVLGSRTLAVLLVLVLWLFYSGILFASPPPINHTQPELIWPDTVEMVIETDDSVRSVRFYFLRPGMDQYQMRFMKPMGEGVFAYRFDASTLDSPTFQYYFELRTDEGVYSYPDDAPATPLMVEGDRDGIEFDITEAPAKLVKDEEAVSTGSITLNGSLEYSVERDNKVKNKSVTVDDTDETREETDDTSRFSEEDFLADFNLRLAKTWEKGDTSISFDTNLTYTSHPLEDEQDGGISSILLEVKRPHQHLRIGDLEVVGTELVGESLNTRGVGYQYSRGRFTAEVYYMNSRQTTVVEDSIPDSDNYIAGAKLGIDVIRDHFHIDLHYIKGNDDPSIATNSSGSEVEILKGNLFSIAPRISFFDKALSFVGEYAESDSGKETKTIADDTTDTEDDWDDWGDYWDDGSSDETDTDTDDLTDSAWRTGVEIEKGPWRVSGFYKHIGAHYQSLINLDELYFSVDREGFDLDFEYFSDNFDVLITWEDLTDNLEDDSTKEWSKYQSVSITPTWRVTDKLSLSVGHTNSQERSYKDKDRTDRLSDFAFVGFNAGVDYSFSDSSAVQFTWSWDEMESYDSPESDSVTSTVTFNYSYYGDLFQFYPGISYSQTDTEEELDETLNVYISGEYFFIPEILSVSTNDSFTWTKGEVAARTRLMSLTASINLKLGWIHGTFSDTVFSIVGEYEEDDQEDTGTESYSISTKLDFMF